MTEIIKSQLRLPADVKAWVADQAAQHERSQNSQIVWLLRQAMAAPALSNSQEKNNP